MSDMSLLPVGSGMGSDALAAACVCAYHEMTCEEKHRGNI